MHVSNYEKQKPLKSLCLPAFVVWICTSIVRKQQTLARHNPKHLCLLAVAKKQTL